MAEQLIINTNTSKAALYQQLLPQLNALVNDETNFIANSSNIIAALKSVFNFFWVGIYFVDTHQKEELVLGPFQGPIACTRIKYGKGVCGTSWKQKKTIIVANVNEFPGHIACSSLSKSEIVVPVFDTSGNVIMILDIDSEVLNTFDEEDQHHLEKIALILYTCFQKNI